MARIIFLGTAGDSAVVSRQLRNSGGIIVQVGDLQFHLDPGPGALCNARNIGINPRHTSVIMVSNNHINHCNDLNVLIDTMTHGGIEHRGIVVGSKSIIQGDENNNPYLTNYHKSLIEKVIPVEKNHKIGIELVEVNTLPLKQLDETAVGFKIFCPKFTLTYIPNSVLTPEIMESASSSDMLIVGVPYPKDKGNGQSMDTQSAIKLVSHVRPKVAVITGFGLEMLKADPIQEAREIQRITGVQTVAAKDGLIMAPEGYGSYKNPIKGYE